MGLLIDTLKGGVVLDYAGYTEDGIVVEVRAFSAGANKNHGFILAEQVSLQSVVGGLLQEITDTEQFAALHQDLLLLAVKVKALLDDSRQADLVAEIRAALEGEE